MEELEKERGAPNLCAWVVSKLSANGSISLDLLFACRVAHLYVL